MAAAEIIIAVPSYPGSCSRETRLVHRPPVRSSAWRSKVKRPRARSLSDGPSPGFGSFRSTNRAVGGNIIAPMRPAIPALTRRARSHERAPRPTFMASR